MADRRGLDWLFGPRHGHLMVLGADAATLAFMLTIEHLLHSHVWINFRCALGRVLMSPAHHRIHHFTDPRHFIATSAACSPWSNGCSAPSACRRSSASR